MLKCVAIDDEHIALAILTRYCQQYGNIRLETFTSPPLVGIGNIIISMGVIFVVCAASSLYFEWRSRQ